MNELSWILYFAQVGETLRDIIFPIFGLTFVFSIFGFIISFIDPILFNIRKFVIFTLCISLVIILTTCFIPDRTTMYLIAVSQTAEKIAENPKTTELLELEKKLIKSEIEKNLKESNK
jgi:hypothetical protein